MARALGGALGSTGIQGRKKRQVLEMFREEQPHLRPLPVAGFHPFKQGTRTVDDAGLVQIDGAYYAALPAAPHSEVTVRVYARAIEILDAGGQVLRRHEKTTRKGAFVLESADRLFNPSRETARLLTRVEKIGPHTAALARELFARLGRPGQRAIYGLANLPRRYPRAAIEAVCARPLAAQCVSFAAVRRALEHQVTPVVATPELTHHVPQIRAITEYQSFWETHFQAQPEEEAMPMSITELERSLRSLPGYLA